MEKILVVDDDEGIRSQLKWGLCGDYEVVTAADRVAALSLVDAHTPRVVTLDLGLPPDAGGSSEGMLCLQQILDAAPHTKVIVVTGNDTRSLALQAVQLGAYDFCNKPLQISELQTIVRRACHLSAIEEENRSLHDVLDDEGTFCGLYGRCPAMLDVYATVGKVSASDVPVLITGESGTGKELVAQAIRTLSRRRNEAFVTINAGAIPENLLESELFGHEKGAFTGAASRVQGKVEYAHRGTLFLDEIGELPLALQVKLLRFIQEKIIQRVGGREDLQVDARIVSATNRDLPAAIREGIFREDLYYRISVITIDLPPLRERGDDIMFLAHLFLKKFSAQFRKKVRAFTPAVRRLMETYPWPGNVRELENRIQRAVLLAESHTIDVSVLGLGALAGTMEGAVPGVTLREARDRVEREMIRSAIRREGSIARAAENLGISRPTLYDLMRKHNVEGSQ